MLRILLMTVGTNCISNTRVNEAVKNNPDKFPNDYMFEISEGEFVDLRSKFSTAKFAKTRALPKALTEKGLYMIATILKSKQATEATFAIIETFLPNKRHRDIHQAELCSFEIQAHDKEEKMKKICIFTATRAEYGLLRWVIQGIQDAPDLTLQIIARGMHLSPEFGLTIQEIRPDGFKPDETVERLLSSDTPTAICKSMGLALIGYGEALHRLNPDIMKMKWRNGDDWPWQHKKPFFFL
jgi:hypothetical protein